MCHPEQQIQETNTASSTAKVLMPAPKSTIEKFFPKPPNPVLPSVKSTSCGRVLTSCENIKLLEEKQQKKDEENKRKKEWKRQREEWKIQKEQRKFTKNQQRKTQETGLGKQHIKKHFVIQKLLVITCYKACRAIYSN